LTGVAVRPVEHLSFLHVPMPVDMASASRSAGSKFTEVNYLRVAEAVAALRMNLIARRVRTRGAP
jgi:hypothetical protein